MATWHDYLSQEKQELYFRTLLARVESERASGQIIFPPQQDVFNALSYTEFDQIKVVILGQDPYHNINQANGLAFSVNQGIKVPPSLHNIYKELMTDIDGFQMPGHGSLVSWAKQGVLLLNNVLTVNAHQANSHANWGWERFTDKVIEVVNEHQQNVVFMLWGNPAQKKGSQIDATKHLVLKAPHPSPLSAYRGFFGCQHFSKANDYLQKHGKTPINWVMSE